jgi:hypothetical protein
MPEQVPVSDVESLYAAVNDAGNAGKTIVAERGVYRLTRLNPLGVERPNGGRLELQEDMSLSGVNGHPGRVVIDSSDPANGPSFELGPGINAGTIRMGRGRQTVESLTVIGGTKSAGGIQTDLVGGPPTLRIAHVVCKGSVRGIDVRNLGPEGAGRVLTVELDDNEVTGNVAGTGQGLRFVNTASDGASIVASLKRNLSHANKTGFLAANQGSNGASVTIDSHNDRFDDNGIGGVILGGVQGAAASVANDNVVNLTMHAGSIARNDGVPQTPDAFSGGLNVVGGAGTAPGSTSRNTVKVSIVGLKFSDNLNTDVKAWGAKAAGGPAGTRNTAAVELQGVSAQAVTAKDDSEPDEPAGTNRATIEQ